MSAGEIKTELRQMIENETGHEHPGSYPYDLIKDRSQSCIEGETDDAGLEVGRRYQGWPSVGQGRSDLEDQPVREDEVSLYAAGDRKPAQRSESEKASKLKIEKFIFTCRKYFESWI